MKKFRKIFISDPVEESGLNNFIVLKRQRQWLGQLKSKAIFHGFVKLLPQFFYYLKIFTIRVNPHFIPSHNAFVVKDTATRINMYIIKLFLLIPSDVILNEKVHLSIRFFSH